MAAKRRPPEPTADAELHKQHFACFACRKAFKPRGSEETGVEAERSFPCPECGREMVVMGRDFQAPPQRAVRQWQMLEMLRSFGVIFEPGQPQPPAQPKTMREAEEFLVKQGYDAEVVRKRLDKIRQERQATKPPTRAERKRRERRFRR